MTIAGTISRSAEGFVTVSQLGHGVTTSRITPSALTVPSGLVLASRTSGETAREDARLGMMDMTPTKEHREPCFQDMVRGEQRFQASNTTDRSP